VIINVTGGPDLSLVEVSEASSIVQEAADEDANIIFGAVVDPALKGKVKITVIATASVRRRARRRVPPQAPGMTPVDMSAYADAAREPGRSSAAVAGGGSGWLRRLSLRRPRPAAAASRSICRLPTR
jgi:cell division GTPase FtsZ